jgi:Tol biopolymer transport system component
MGICLTADRGVLTTYAAVLFNERGEQLRTIPLAGVPSRCRMSPDGKTAADTIFLTGHSYSSMDFTTQTRLLDTATGAVIADLEDFAVTRDGAPFHAKDFNFWGVTFTPDSRGFYCTLSSDRKHYLVRGDMKTRTASVVHENVECPSVSPDGTRVAYKKRFAAGHRLQWQLHVLDLASSTETPLSERRSVDDQLEWLDNENVLYAVPSAESSAGADIWRADAGGQGMPGLFLPLAYSPAVIR